MLEDAVLIREQLKSSDVQPLQKKLDDKNHV